MVGSLYITLAHVFYRITRFCAKLETSSLQLRLHLPFERSMARIAI